MLDMRSGPGYNEFQEKTDGCFGFWWGVPRIEALYWPDLEGYITDLTGRALEWHSRGQRFDPAYLHQKARNLSFTLIRKYSQQLITNADRQGANRELITFNSGWLSVFLSSLCYAIERHF